MGSRARRWGANVCLAMAGILLPLGVLAAWANATFFDSRTFSERTVQLLDSPAMRRELAERITEQLALAGNQQAINLRPAFQLAIEGAINTDAFRSIFRTAVQRAHEQLLRGSRSGALDLSESVSIIANTLQLAQSSKPGEADERSLDVTLTDVTQRVSDLQVWRWDELATALVGVSLVGALLFAAGGIALAGDHRRAVRRLGWIIVAGGLVISALVVVAVWYAGRVVSESQLAQAIQDSVESWTSDLRTIGLWLAGYGVVAAAAAAPDVRRITPGSTAAGVRAWIERQRATTASTLGLAVLFVVAGAMLVANPSFWLRVAILGFGLWLIYFGVTEVLTLVRSKAPAPATAREREGAGVRRRLTRRLLLSGAAIVAVLAIMSAGLFTTTSHAAREASALGAPKCNGDEELCDLPLNRVVFPGTHNSMSAALNPGWLFAEHVRTIASQLEGGVRALLIDTHYGVASSSRLPGSDTPLILTDRAAELSHPSVEQSDPETAARAASLAAKSSPRADAIRDLYLCHNYCELGAVLLAEVLQDIKTFLDTHPDDVVMTIIQDATTPADTAQAFISAGLEERVYTLRSDQPMPTLRQMIDERRTLLVFAEEGGPGAPPWYHKAYEQWFQETPYQFEMPADMTCVPNRGTATAPLFLVNHWLHASPPNPAKANSVNRRDPLVDRLKRCLTERGLVPNVVAVDFAEQGNFVDTVQEINSQLIDQLRQVRGQPKPTTSSPPGPTIPTSTTVPSPVAAASPLPLPTPTVVTSLTGGDPTAFCARAPDVRSTVSAWALAQLVAPQGGTGLSDLAFGPAAARAFDAIAPDLPAELAQVSAPTRDRARAAVKALTDLGITTRAIEELAELAETRLSGAEYPDPVAVQTALLDRERALAGQARLDAAGTAFAAANPEVPGLFDLGDVSDDVARSRGFSCLVSEAG